MNGGRPEVGGDEMNGGRPEVGGDEMKKRKRKKELMIETS